MHIIQLDNRVNETKNTFHHIIYRVVFEFKHRYRNDSRHRK